MMLVFGLYDEMDMFVGRWCWCSVKLIPPSIYRLN